jgi:hypothetical protein
LAAVINAIIDAIADLAAAHRDAGDAARSGLARNSR